MRWIKYSLFNAASVGVPPRLLPWCPWQAAHEAARVVVVRVIVSRESFSSACTHAAHCKQTANARLKCKRFIIPPGGDFHVVFKLTLLFKQRLPSVTQVTLIAVIYRAMIACALLQDKLSMALAGKKNGHARHDRFFNHRC
jgi:hypothetical protein